MMSQLFLKMVCVNCAQRCRLDRYQSCTGLFPRKNVRMMFVNSDEYDCALEMTKSLYKFVHRSGASGTGEYDSVSLTGVYSVPYHISCLVSKQRCLQRRYRGCRVSVPIQWQNFLLNIFFYE